MTDGKRIDDYGMIGDGETAALVSRTGAVEWLCLPRFDSDACFAALLGDETNGAWSMAPAAKTLAASRRYLGDSLVLETLFETPDGAVAVIDFMPLRQSRPRLVRLVEGRTGCVEMRSGLAVRFDYGRIHPLVRGQSDGHLVALAGGDAIALRFDAPIAETERCFDSRFSVRAGERLWFTLTWFPAHEQEPEAIDPAAALEETLASWRSWAATSSYDGPYRDLVTRSLLTLKGLIHEPTGGIVAAATASLPERPGGQRNWDYRFCWLRDATLTLLALLHSGLTEEARAWMSWLRRVVAGEPIEIQPFYTVTGGRRAPEWEADWLAGFNGAHPVRFGNAAAGQHQLDVYGEVLDALHVAAQHGVTEDADDLVRLLCRRLEKIWREPDAGLWESRGEPRRHTYSNAMAWVAFDRASRWFERNDATASSHYRALAEEVHAEVLAHGFDRERNAFVRAFDDPALDAAVLRLPLVGFLPADDPRIQSTVAAIERELLRVGVVRRYAPEQTDDGVGGEEGAFLACSFWLADVYVLQGRLDEARDLFERLCARANDLGLLSEEAAYDGSALLGNFPQALSHLGLVNTALNLRAGGGPAHEHSGLAADEVEAIAKAAATD